MTHVHLVGIGGSGISSIARVLVEKGYEVSGSDQVLSSLALALEPAGVKVYEGHSASNIQGADIVVQSSAIPDSNVEVVAARELGIPVQKRAEFLNSLLKEYKCLAVAGSHGKTTTSSMLAWTLDQLGLQPGFILGGISKNLGTNARAGQGGFFVIEADEYDYMFLGLDPQVILLTNVEYDHPDCFPTLADYQSAFASFVRRLKPGGTLVTNVDHPGSRSMIKNLPAQTQAITYGLNDDAMIRAIHLQVNQFGGMTFSAVSKLNPELHAIVVLSVPGVHNVSNALGVLAVNYVLGNPFEKAARALSSFSGTSRRFDIVGELNGITFIDDYAHHPGKILATLAAARARFPHRRIIAVWQPHTFSRTRALESEFAASFHDADLVIVTDIFAAREKPQDYSLENLVKNINYVPAFHLNTLNEVSSFLVSNLIPGDVLIIMSAGDANQINRDVMNQLKERKG